MSDVQRDEEPAEVPERAAGYDDLGPPDWADGSGESDGSFHTDAVKANLAAERGLGLGAAELAAQRDPAGAVRDASATDEDDDDAEGDA